MFSLLLVVYTVVGHLELSANNAQAPAIDVWEAVSMVGLLLQHSRWSHLLLLPCDLGVPQDLIGARRHRGSTALHQLPRARKRPQLPRLN